MKRVSVWRSKLLKISAITSCASRRRVCDRLDMNSVRSVCSTRSMTSFCTASIFSMRLTHVEREVLGQDREHAGGVLRPQLRQHHRDGLRVFVLEIVGEHLFLDVGELLPHVAAGGAADFVHDAADALGRQVLLQQALGGVVVAQQRAGGRHARRRIRAAGPRPTSASTVPSVDMTIDSSRSSSSSSRLPDLAAILFAERQHQDGGALRAGQLARAVLGLLAAARARPSAPPMSSRRRLLSFLVAA